MAVRQPRYSLERLLRVLGDDPADLSAEDIARMAGVHPRQVQRWRAEGGMTFDHADRFACRVWLNSEIVWPEAHMA